MDVPTAVIAYEGASSWMCVACVPLGSARRRLCAHLICTFAAVEGKHTDCGKMVSSDVAEHGEIQH